MIVTTVVDGNPAAHRAPAHPADWVTMNTCSSRRSAERYAALAAYSDNTSTSHPVESRTGGDDEGDEVDDGGDRLLEQACACANTWRLHRYAGMNFRSINLEVSLERNRTSSLRAICCCTT